MPTMLKVHEAKANFSGVLSEVENNLTVITILRYGRPVAKIVPVTPERDMSPLPGFAGHVRMKGDWFADESSDWENA
jgi:prevent-host-death family protein